MGLDAWAVSEALVNEVSFAGRSMAGGGNPGPASD